MINTMGIIYTTKDDLTLREMTASRAVAALPVAGRYRMIDFVLSNMVNSGVRNVGVIMQKNYHSLMDHLGSGKEWDLHTRNDGLRILPPFLTRENVGEYSGNIDALRSNAGFLRRSRQEYVILSASHTVFNTTYYDMLAEHIASNADITLMYVKARPSDIDYSVASNESHAFADIDETGRVLEIESIVPYDPKRLKRELKGCGAEVLKRDFPLPAEELMRRLGLHPGADVRLAFTKTGNDFWVIRIK